MEKFSTLMSPNFLLCLSLIQQSELFHSSSQHPSKSSPHKGIVEFCNSWYGSYYIHVRNWLSYIKVVQCKTTTHFNQTMLGTASHYRDYVQCQSWDWETWHTCFNIQRAHEKISFSQEWKIWIMVLPWRHQILYVCVAVWKNVLNWPIVPNTWLVKISTNLSKEEV